MSEGNPSLFERLGGHAGVARAVERFYARLTADPLTAPFFEGIDMERQRAKQVGFLTMVFGGPTPYTGRSLGASHARLVEAGLGDAHVDAISRHLFDTLAEQGIPDLERTEAIAIAESMRDHVLGRG